MNSRGPWPSQGNEAADHRARDDLGKFHIASDLDTQEIECGPYDGQKGYPYGNPDQ